MRGIECMEINCFFGDDVFMAFFDFLTHSALQSTPTFLRTSHSSLRGFALCGIIDSIADFSGIRER